MIGIVKSTSIGKNRDGKTKVLLIQAEIGDADDIQTIELGSAMGEDFHPTPGTKILINEAGKAYKVAVAGDDGIEPSTNAGERKIYSIAGGGIAAVIYLMADGTAQINGGEGMAVEFGRMKEAFDQLKSDFDNHTHSYSPGPSPPALTTVPTASPSGTPPAPSTADMSDAKSETVKIP